jgi:hypothetical protein
MTTEQQAHLSERLIKYLLKDEHKSEYGEGATALCKFMSEIELTKALSAINKLPVASRFLLMELFTQKSKDVSQWLHQSDESKIDRFTGRKMIYEYVHFGAGVSELVIEIGASCVFGDEHVGVGAKQAKDFDSLIFRINLRIKEWEELFVDEYGVQRFSEPANLLDVLSESEQVLLARGIMMDWILFGARRGPSKKHLMWMGENWERLNKQRHIVSGYDEVDEESLKKLEEENSGISGTLFPGAL